jgi:hypothetical protein
LRTSAATFASLLVTAVLLGGLPLLEACAARSGEGPAAGASRGGAGSGGASGSEGANGSGGASGSAPAAGSVGGGGSGVTSGDTPGTPSVVDPLSTAYHRAAEVAAAARVPDLARGGPPVRDGASPLPPFLGVSRATARYVGPDTCAACHPTAAATWSASGHAHAVATLREHQASANPACLNCHVTGLGHPGGWAGASTPALASVSCEACHGPGGDHAAAPAAGYGDLPADAAACVACHTHDNSPEFRFADYWPKVAHGR